jgi:7-carboxy-7-deazaguanine synthase
MRVVELFGPTIQGEGPHAGRVCHFLRLGGCDYRCSWCDTMHAVDPEQVKLADNLSVGEVLDRLDALHPAPMLVISGGNPALHRLDGLLDELHASHRYRVIGVETQGSRWRDWLGRVDSLVVSPKPPSSGECTPLRETQFARFMGLASRHRGLVLKVVIFDGVDLEWAAKVHAAMPFVPFYLSVGTDQDVGDPLPVVAERYAWLAERVAHSRLLADAVVLPQLHVIAWGHAVGV